MDGRGQQAAVQGVWHGGEESMRSMPRERHQALLLFSEVPENGLASALSRLWHPHSSRAMTLTEVLAEVAQEPVSGRGAEGRAEARVPFWEGANRDFWQADKEMRERNRAHWRQKRLMAGHWRSISGKRPLSQSILEEVYGGVVHQLRGLQVRDGAEHGGRAQGCIIEEPSQAKVRPRGRGPLLCPPPGDAPRRKAGLWRRGYSHEDHQVSAERAQGASCGSGTAGGRR